LEDNIAEKLYENMSITSSNYQNKNKFESKVLELFEEYFSSRLDAFQEQLDKLNVTTESN
jgi:hypothetical protein